MPHTGMDLKFHCNPKVVNAGRAAIGVYAMSLSFCADSLTDGAVPGGWAKAFGKPAEINDLLDAGLWVKEGSDYRIPDFLDHNLRAEKVREMSVRGRTKADTRWEKRRKAEQNGAHNGMHGALQCAKPERGEKVQKAQYQANNPSSHETDSPEDSACTLQCSTPTPTPKSKAPAEEGIEKDSLGIGDYAGANGNGHAEVDAAGRLVGIAEHDAPLLAALLQETRIG